MQIIDGQSIADDMLSRLKQKPALKKFLAGFVMGNDAASLSFQQLKKRTGEQLGVDYRIFELPENSTDSAAREQVAQTAKDPQCGGVIVQLPLPSRLNRSYILSAIPADKDADVIGEHALGSFYNSASRVLPPAVGALQEVLLHSAFHILHSTKIAIIGPGFLVGKPIAVWLMNNHIAHLDVIGRGGDLSVLKNADLVILGAGQANMIKPEMLKNGAGVVDFSYSKNDDGKLVGDFDVSSLNLKPTTYNLSFYTPTPGGTGPILVAKLFENFYTLNS
jgi:methylenetetrahydrofolate dehydrogenase (NADP+) / methenyltetrahydrofolate cyclohydrolase